MLAAGLTSVLTTALIAAEPIFVESVAGQLQDGVLTLEIAGESALDPATASGRITDNVIGISIEGGMARPDKLRWESGDVQIAARRRNGRVKLEVPFPVGTTCKPPVRISGTDDGKLQAAISCAPGAPAKPPTTEAVPETVSPSLAAPAEEDPVKPAEDVAPSAAPTRAEAPPTEVPAPTTTSSAVAEVLPTPAKPVTEEGSDLDQVKTVAPWGLCGILLLVILFTRRKSSPELTNDEPLDRTDDATNPLKVLVVAELEGRHFLLGSSDTRAQLVRPIVQAKGATGEVQEVLLTPVGSAKRLRNGHNPPADSVEAKLSARILGDQSDSGSR